MNYSILFLRYVLILIPAIATIYLSDRILSEPRYVALLLALLLFIQWRDRKWEKRFAAMPISPLLLIEIACLSVMTYAYGGILSFAYLSSLISLSNRPNGFAAHALLVGALMNVIANPQLTWPMLLTMNLAFLTIAILLRRFSETTGNKLEIEAVYNELKVKHYDLEATRKTVTEYANKVQELAQLEERNRIAHDLHDDLGHKLIRLKMMLEAAARIGDGGQHDKVIEIVKEVRDQLGESMESLRSTVRRIKPNPALTRQYSLENLIAQYARESGVVVSYEMTGAPYSLYPSDEFILFRNAQEAITNAIRHGQATKVHILLDYAPERLRMAVSNNGIVPGQQEIRRGLGLLGMEDRVRVVGGSLHVGTDPHFEIQTILPRR